MFGITVRTFRRLETKQVENKEEIRAFFDACSHEYADQHGRSERLLKDRIALIKRVTRPESHHVVLDLGCGIGHYLMALAGDIGRGVGIDFSHSMIKAAKKRVSKSPWREKLEFRIDDAEELQTISNASVDMVMCMGALEHIPKRDAVLSSANRVLKRGGQIVLMTPNGGYVWYQFMAPVFRFDTQHLSTDQFLEAQTIAYLLSQADFTDVSYSWWTFIPRGDMHPMFSGFLLLLDWLGKFFHIPGFRGGLIATARKP
ncbi:MAG: methyltransferase domain-containing protein [Proteobacteria bacterium]|nr:methyltransferase domain-containing protein [Pseudomonadota bacterium]NIS72757.1 methyltransferase domain-containing protein [Pseudomonadota bacterium]